MANATHRVDLGVEPTVHNSSTYTNWRCRCDKCRQAWAAYTTKARHSRAERLKKDPTLAEHGTNSTYLNWACRCPACTTAHNEVRRTQSRRG